jgi:hypothetical protein
LNTLTQLDLVLYTRPGFVWLFPAGIYRFHESEPGYNQEQTSSLLLYNKQRFPVKSFQYVKTGYELTCRQYFNIANSSNGKVIISTQYHFSFSLKPALIEIALRSIRNNIMDPLAGIGFFLTVITSVYKLKQ